MTTIDMMLALLLISAGQPSLYLGILVVNDCVRKAMVVLNVMLKMRRMRRMDKRLMMAIYIL